MNTIFLQFHTLETAFYNISLNESSFFSVHAIELNGTETVQNDPTVEISVGLYTRSVTPQKIFARIWLFPSVGGL